MLVDAVLDAVKTRLETIDGLTVTTNPNSPVVPPMAVVTDGDMEYHATFGRGFDALDLTIDVHLSSVDSTSGLLEARDYKSGHGAKSIRAALETAVADEFPNGTLVAVTGRVTTAEADGDGMYIRLTVDATAQIPGTA